MCCITDNPLLHSHPNISPPSLGFGCKKGAFRKPYGSEGRAALMRCKWTTHWVASQGSCSSLPRSEPHRLPLLHKMFWALLSGCSLLFHEGRTRTNSITHTDSLSSTPIQNHHPVFCFVLKQDQKKPSINLFPVTPYWIVLPVLHLILKLSSLPHSVLIKHHPSISLSAHSAWPDYDPLADTAPISSNLATCPPFKASTRWAMPPFPTEPQFQIIIYFHWFWNPFFLRNGVRPHVQRCWMILACD